MKRKPIVFPAYFYEQRRPETGFHLRETHLVIQQAIRERLRPFGIPPGQAFILNALLHGDGISQIDLGTRIGVPPSQLVATLRKLERSKHIVRKRSPKDQRLVLIYLTAKGRKIDRIMRPILTEVTDICLAGLNEKQIRAFIAALTKIRHNVLQKLNGNGHRAMRGLS